MGYRSDIRGELYLTEPEIKLKRAESDILSDTVLSILFTNNQYPTTESFKNEHNHEHEYEYEQ